MEANLLLLVIGITYIICLVISLVYIFYPPKSINQIYGYRTARSMETAESWAYANKLAAKLLLVLTHVVLFLSLAVYFLFLKLHFSLILAVIMLLVCCFALGFVFPIVETILKKVFIVIIWFCFSSTLSAQQMTLKVGNIRMKGQLEVPKNNLNSESLVIFIAGSGPTDMNGNSGNLKCDNLKMLASSLRDKNIATFRFDKRVVDQSNLRYINESHLTIDTFANDVILWVKYLNAAKPSYKKIYLLGHSEGSLIAGIVANKMADLSVISISGSGRTADKVILEQILKNAPALVNESSKIIDTILKGKIAKNPSPELLSVFRPSVQPYLSSWFKYNPATIYQQIPSPKNLFYMVNLIYRCLLMKLFI